ncbi:MAG: hypothetical protein JOZ25_03410 [Actinobacteria bacterium]|nr:hypothetical protein [Actinomycetota bacterium]
MRARRRTSIAAATLTAVLAAVPLARADSDPASDVLPVQNVFVPYQPQVSQSLQQTLRAETAAAAKSGFPIKVAIVATAQDLGGVPDFFGKPQPYARYLGSEISFSKPQPLLVVMPSGLGTYQVPPKAAAVARGMTPGAGPDGMATTAVKTIEQMATAAGHKIGSYKAGGSGGGKSSTALIFAGPIVLLVIALVVFSYRRMGQEEEELEELRSGSG